MSDVLRVGKLAFALKVPVPAEAPAPPAEGPLHSDELEHGAYYAGRLGAAPAFARWHARKRRFVYGEYSMGKLHIRAVPHICDSATAASFAPLSKTQPKDAYRVSDYAFETAH
jgi:hypothetical protein